MPSYQYTPTTWVTGDTITAEKLNNIEQGIKYSHNPNKLYLCTCTNDTLDHTYNEVKAALLDNKNVYLTYTENDVTYYQLLANIGFYNNTYLITFYNTDGATFSGDSATGSLTLAKIK